MARRKNGTSGDNCRRGLLKVGERWTPCGMDMLTSPAWLALNAKAMHLYLLGARTQEANARKHADRVRRDSAEPNPNLYPLDQWELEAEYEGRTPFYLNEALLVYSKDRASTKDWLARETNGKRLYTDAKTLKRDRQKLVAYGFLDEIPVGAEKQRNRKAVYLLSDRWRGMTGEDIAKIKEK